MAIYNEDELFWWKMGQSSRVRSIQSAPKKAGGRTAGEVAIRAGNTVAWYDYTDLTTITKTGSAVSLWADKLGSGRNLTCANITYSVTDGMQIAAGAGTMTTGAITLNQPEMIYIVVRHYTAGANKYFFTGITQLLGILYENHATDALLSIFAGSILGTRSLAFNTWGIIRVLFNGASSKLIINDGTPLTGNAGASNMGGFTAGVFNRNQVDYKEIIIRNKVDTSTDEANIYAYLKAKYSL